MAKKQEKEHYHAMLRMSKAEKNQIEKKSKLEFKWAKIYGKLAMLEAMLHNPDIDIMGKMHRLQAKRERRMTKEEKLQISTKNDLECKWAKFDGKLKIICQILENPDLDLQSKIHKLEEIAG
ncbi:unnamed protein product [Cochlearia groenlandica]